ncbi:MAG: hypothetical protein WA137_08035 [Methanothrix sp.]
MKIVISRLGRENLPRIGIMLLLVLVVSGGAYAWHEYDEFFSIPATRLQADGFYPEMPPDAHHHYLQIPLDHGNPYLGNFTAFYLLSPGFSAGEDVVFWLFDNQQERVGMINSSADFGYFEESLEGLPYVLIGNRGVSPTLFPEVFNRGSTAPCNRWRTLKQCDRTCKKGDSCLKTGGSCSMAAQEVVFWFSNTWTDTASMYPEP